MDVRFFFRIWVSFLFVFGLFAACDCCLAEECGESRGREDGRRRRRREMEPKDRMRIGSNKVLHTTYSTTSCAVLESSTACASRVYYRRGARTGVGRRWRDVAMWWAGMQKRRRKAERGWWCVVVMKKKLSWS